MAQLDETPRGNRVRIAFFGLRNAGKSTLVNAFAGQPLAIVSDTPGTTTDPVSKAMEILPLGPCLITDTAGLDDEGELGEMRVKKSLDVLSVADIAVWVDDGENRNEELKRRFLKECAKHNVQTIDYRRGDDVEELKRRIASVKLNDEMPGLLDGLVKAGDSVLCVCPIDASAPKGRLILPQVQVIRECLDIGAWVEVCQPSMLAAKRARLGGFNLVITDSQAFGEVKAQLPEGVRLTGFSMLFARQKGDIAEFEKGLARIAELNDGDLVVVAEGCTHHRQCDDIGTVKIPAAIARLSSCNPRFEFISGAAFNLSPEAKLVVQCGGCMLTRREMMRRIALAKASNVPIVNYGMVLSKAQTEDAK